MVWRTAKKSGVFFISDLTFRCFGCKVIQRLRMADFEFKLSLNEGKKRGVQLPLLYRKTLWIE